MKHPQAGDLIRDTGGLRKVQFWLFTLYDKDEADDLTPAQRKTLRAVIKAELDARSKA
jgi:hypothetical protein